MTRVNMKRNTGFSLIELIIVVVIIAIIGAIAIPRMSRGAAGASDSALVGDLAVLRSAIDLYAAEHGGTFPDATNFTNVMTGYTDASGDAQATKDASHIYGPYLRKIPPLPVGTNKNATSVADGTSVTTPGGSADGWWYDPTSGVIKANLASTEVDASNTAYSAY